MLFGHVVGKEVTVGGIAPVDNHLSCTQWTAVNVDEQGSSIPFFPIIGLEHVPMNSMPMSILVGKKLRGRLDQF